MLSTMPEQEPQTDNLPDVIIVGAGPTGLSAAIYTARAGLKTLVLGTPEKSQLAKAHKVENYFGIASAPGATIISTGVQQAEHFGARILREDVLKITPKDDQVTVHTNQDHEYQTRSLLIATGMAYQMGGIEGEERLVGKGVHYCVLCDGYFYRGKNVAVIGRHDFAAEEALELLQYTKHITIFSQGKPFEISNALMRRLEESSIKLREEEVVKFEGETLFEQLRFADQKTEDFDGVFMAIGTAGAISFARTMGLDTDRTSIKVDKEMHTNIPRIYAAGACTGGIPQLAKEVGEGCIAAVTIIKEHGQKRMYVDYG